MPTRLSAVECQKLDFENTNLVWIRDLSLFNRKVLTEISTQMYDVKFESSHVRAVFANVSLSVALSKII